MNYLIVTRGNSQTNFYINNAGFYGYTLRQAIAKYKAEHGLKYKRNVIVIDTRK